MTDQKPDLLALREGLPEGPWIILPREDKGVTFDTDASWFVATRATGQFVCGYFSKQLARAIAAIPSMFEEIERLRQEVLDLENRCRSYADIALENDRLRAELDIAREAGKMVTSALLAQETTP